MSEYEGKTEQELRTLLDESLEYDERRKIRAAIRDVKKQRVGLLSSSAEVGGPVSAHSNGTANGEPVRSGKKQPGENGSVQQPVPGPAMENSTKSQKPQELGLSFSAKEAPEPAKNVAAPRSKYEDVTDEDELNKLLQKASGLEEKREIRKALRKLQENKENQSGRTQDLSPGHGSSVRRSQSLKWSPGAGTSTGTAATPVGGTSTGVVVVAKRELSTSRLTHNLNGDGVLNGPEDLAQRQKSLQVSRLQTALSFFRQREEQEQRPGGSAQRGVGRTQSMRLQPQSGGQANGNRPALNVLRSSSLKRSGPDSSSSSSTGAEPHRPIIQLKAEGSSVTSTTPVTSTTSVTPVTSSSSRRRRRPEMMLSAEEQGAEEEVAAAAPESEGLRVVNNGKVETAQVMETETEDAGLPSLHELKAKLTSLEEELDDSRDFDVRRGLRVAIRDIRAQIRDGKYTETSPEDNGEQNGNTDDQVATSSVLLSPTAVTSPIGDVSDDSMRDSNHNTVTYTEEVPLKDGKQNITMTLVKTRTPSQSDYCEKETVVETEVSTPTGSKHQETNIVTTKTKLTKRGSNYYEKSAVTRRKIATPAGSEYLDGQVLVEKDSKSVSRGQHLTESAEVKFSSESEATNGGSLDTVPDEEEKLEDAEDEPPEIVQPLADQSALDGQPCAFQCTVAAPPGAKVTWYAGAKLLHPSKDFKQSFEGKTARLEIAEVFPDDQAEYRCVVSTETGQAETNAFLIIEENQNLVVPSFEKPLTDTSANDGQEARLSCQVTGTPEPSIAWYKGQDLLKDGRDFKQTHAGNTAALTIQKALPEHDGSYSCVAKNSTGEARCTCRLTISNASLKSTPPPEFTRSLQSCEVKEGEMLTLTCSLKDMTSTAVTWYKDSKELSSNGRCSVKRLGGNEARLEIAKAALTDAGDYTCEAKNLSGKASCNAKVTVTQAVVTSSPASNQPPEFIQPLSNMTLIDGEPGTISCAVSSSSSSSSSSGETSIFWYRNNKILRAGTEYRQKFDGKTVTLRIREVFPDDAGAYDCVARNAFGKTRTSCRVTVKDKNDTSETKDTMPNIEEIDDEDELHKILTQTDDFEQRKKIRGRMRDIREAKSAEFERNRQARDANKEDAITMRHRQAEAAKQKKIKELSDISKQPKGVSSGEQSRRDRHAASEEEKKKKVASYTEMGKDRAKLYGAGTSIVADANVRAADVLKEKALQAFDEEAVSRTTKTEQGKDGSSCTTTTSTTTQKTKDGSSTVTKRTKQVTQTGGIGGTSYQVDKTSAAAGGGAKTLGAPSGGGGVAIQRSPSSVKQILLDWCIAMTREYAEYGVEITNFSSSWNNGMAFCALIHHFYPRAFDFKKLNPKARRGNFKLGFDVAEKLAGIAPLLDVDDMVKMKNPDWKCVFTYIQSFYRRFRMEEANAQKPE